jgi:hypothetical protein
VQIADPPFRWDLVTPDRLGELPPVLFPYAEDLVIAAGQVLARSGGGDMFFVGRSPDSLFDLLSGALDGAAQGPRLHRLAYSRRAGGPRLAARAVLARQGLTPYTLARGRRPVALIDLVYGGNTFTDLYALLRDWIDEEREPWPVIRRRLRFVGLTAREETSPKAFRWQQCRAWPAALPARAVVNVSVDPPLWSYLGNYQPKLTASFHAGRWFAEPEGPRRGERVRAALAQAAGLVELGRKKQTRALLVRTVTAEPAYREGWLRGLVVELGR